jgi:hypothetical protein
LLPFLLGLLGFLIRPLLGSFRFLAKLFLLGFPLGQFLLLPLICLLFPFKFLLPLLGLLLLPLGFLLLPLGLLLPLLGLLLLPFGFLPAYSSRLFVPPGLFLLPLSLLLLPLSLLLPLLGLLSLLLGLALFLFNALLGLGTCFPVPDYIFFFLRYGFALKRSGLVCLVGFPFF